jgi:hypothetical protein
LVNLSSSISYALQCRQKWGKFIKTIVNDISDEFNKQINSNQDVCGLNENEMHLNGAFNVILEKHLNANADNTFDVTLCLLELRMYYSNLFIVSNES